jgi:glycine dehydrogenase
MVEPTESESKAELDRFIEALYSIYDDINAIREGKMDFNNNPLRNSPHTAEMLISDDWQFEYSRKKAAYPIEWVKENKFFPAVARIDDGYGDRTLVCTCKPIEDYE